MILAMDANDTMDAEKSQLKRFITSTGLIDSMSHRHRHPPRTCIKGARRINYIFLSPTLVPAMRRVGQLGIQDAILSDHCGIWIDFNVRKLFKGSTESLSSILEAPFNLRQTMKVEKYIATMESHLKETRVEERLDALAATQLSLPEYVEQYEKIRMDADVAMQAGVKAVRRKNVGYARSPALMKAASLVRYWKTQLSSLRTSSPFSEKTVEFAKTHVLLQSVQSSAIIFQGLHQAWAHLRHVQKYAAELREAWLDQMAEDAAIEMNTSKENALKQMAQEAKLRRIFRKIKALG